MNETNKAMNDEFPDRLSVDPNSPYHNAEILARDVGSAWIQPPLTRGTAHVPAQ